MLASAVVAAQAAPSRADHRHGDLAIRRVDVSGLAWDCATANASGTVEATVHYVGDEPMKAAPRVLFFQDKDGTGSYDPNIDARLCEATLPAVDPGEDVSVSCAISGQLDFAGAPVSGFVDSMDAVPEWDEISNNVIHSGWSRELPPPDVSWDLADYRRVHAIVGDPAAYDPDADAYVTPAVGQFTDDDANGRIDDRDDPDILCQYQRTWDDGTGRLQIVDGRTFEVHADSPPSLQVWGSTCTVADLEGDGIPEVLAVTGTLTAHAVTAFDNHLNVLWTASRPDGHWGPLIVANLDGRGGAEVIRGSEVFSSTGQFIADGADIGGFDGVWFQQNIDFGPFSSAADLDGDGLLELIVGACAYKYRDGKLSILWKRDDVGEGITAVADMDADGEPEVVIVRGHDMGMLDADGSDSDGWDPPFWHAIGDAEGGGPPTIADITGDGIPEIVALVRGGSVAVRADGSILWYGYVWDHSGFGSIAAFDFDGDGINELVVNDDSAVRIINGTTGVPISADEDVENPTSVNGPVVADVDGDGRADIVATGGDNGGFGGGYENITGLIVYSNPTWASARSCWTQFGYHVSNAEADGGLPRREVPRWVQDPPGDWHRQVSPHGVAHPGPDLTTSRIHIEDDPCGAGSIVTARIGNGGATVARDVAVTLYEGLPDNGSVASEPTVVERLGPGEWADVEFEVPGPIYDAWVVADDDAGQAAIGEVDEDNNACHALVGEDCDPLEVETDPILTLTDPGAVDHGDAVLLQATLLDVAPDPDLPIPGIFVDFTFGTAACRALTDPDGVASCWVTSRDAGEIDLSATSEPTTRWPSDTDVIEDIELDPEETVLVFEMPLVQAGPQLIARARLLEDGALPLPLSPSAPEIGFAIDLASPAAEDADAEGRATHVEPLPPGTYAVSASFAASATHAAVNIGPVEVTLVPMQVAVVPPVQAVRAGDPVTVQAQILDDGRDREDFTIAFALQPGHASDGGDAERTPGDGVTEPDGIVSWTYTAGPPGGTDEIHAWVDFDEDGEEDPGEPVAGAVVNVVGGTETTLAWDISGVTIGNYHDVAVLAAKLTDDEDEPIVDAVITITLDGDPCRTTTGENGVATCYLTPNGPADEVELKAEFAGDPLHAPALLEDEFEVTKEQATLTDVRVSQVFTCNPCSASAYLREDGGMGIGGRTVIFEWHDGDAHEVTATSGSSGLATATNIVVSSPSTVTARFVADDYYESVDPTLGLTVPGGIYNPPPAPSAPTIGTATVLGDGSVDLSFTQHGNAGSEGVTGYAFFVDGTVVASLSKADADTSPARTITQVTNGSSHAFTVRAASKAGMSVASGAANQTTYAVPGPPGDVAATRDPAYAVTWDEPADDGGDAVGQCDIETQPDHQDEADVVSPYAGIADDEDLDRVFWVRCNNTEEGWGPWAPSNLLPNLTPPDEPSAPVDLLATRGPLSQQVTLYWTQPADLGGKAIHHYHVMPTDVEVNFPAVTTVISDLTNGTPATFTVSACHDGAGADCSDPSGDATATPFGPPEAPEITVVRDNGAVHVTYEEADDQGSDILGYLGSAGSAEAPRIGDDAGTIVLTGLDNGIELTDIIAHAVNAADDGEDSDAEIARPAREPEMPTDVALVSEHSGCVTIEWTAPDTADNGGEAVTAYSVTTIPPSGDHPFATAGEHEVCGLSDCVHYAFFVRAVNDVGPGALSDPPVSGTPHSEPKPPRGVTASIAGDRALRLTWLAPDGDDCSGIAGYRVQWTVNAVPASPVDVGPGVHQQILRGLTPGHEYAFEVTTLTSTPDESVPEPSNAVTVATFPEAPDVEASAEAAPGQATVEWTALTTGPERGHAEIIGYRACPLPADAPCVEVPASATEATLTDLNDGTSYQVEVRARNIVGLGPAGVTDTPVIPCSVPYPPLGLEATVTTGTGVLTVTWDEPAWDGGCPVELYVVDPSAGVNAEVEWDDPLEAVFDELTPCTEYTFSVIARNSHGDSAPAEVAADAAEPPDAPIDIGAIGGDGRARVCWSPPEYIGCSPIIGYEIHLEGEGEPPTVPQPDPAGTCIDIVGLQNGEPYDIEVRACNLAGCGDPGTPEAPTPDTITPEVPDLDAVFLPSDPPLMEGLTALGMVQLSGLAGEAIDITLSVLDGPVVLPSTAITIPEGESAASFVLQALGGISSNDTYEIKAELTEDALTYVTEVGDVVTNPDEPPPCTVAVVGPTADDEVTDFGTPFMADIQCAGSPTLSWTVSLRMTSDPDGEWTQICEGSGAVIGDCDIDPTLLLNGQYEVRVEAEDGSSNVMADSVETLVVTGQQKIGHFSMSFVDMTVPAAGIPIQVIRSYDSRDPRDGDFGVGWRLSFSDVRVESSIALGDEWIQAEYGGFGMWGITTKCVEETRKHVVSVTFPDGKVYRFKPTFARAENGTPCSWFAAQAGKMTYVPMGSTRGSLRSVQGDDVYFFAGWLVVLGTEELEDPVEFDRDEFELTTEDGRVWRVKKGEGLKRVVDRNNNSLTIDGDGLHLLPSGKDVEIVRNVDGTVDSIEDPNGKLTHYFYDDLTYGAGTRPALVEFQDRTDAATTFTYQNQAGDAPHRLESVTDATGRRGSLSCYGEDGRLTRVCDGAAGDPDICDDAGPVAHCVEFTPDLDGQEQLIRDRRGNTTRLVYDDRGRVDERWDPGAAAPWEFVYNDDDEVTLAVDPLGHRTETEYDAHGHASVVTQDVDASENIFQTTCYTYTEAGELLERIEDCDPQTREGAAWKSTFDDEGNMLTETDPLGHGTEFYYDEPGNINEVVDELGHVVTLEWSSDGFESKTSESGLREEADHSYLDEDGDEIPDDNGNLRAVRLVDADGNVMTTRMTYDEENRITETIGADGGVSTTLFDAAGRVIRRISALGQVTDTHYDELGREYRTIQRAEEAAPEADPGDDDEVSTQEYDDGDNVIRSVGSDGLITRYAYDALNRAVKTCWGDGDPPEPDPDPDTTEPGCVAQFFDEAGRLTDTADERGNKTSFEYDEANRQIRVLGPDPAGPADRPVAETRYDSLGRVAWTRDPRGVHATHDYDLAGRETRTCLAMDDDESDEIEEVELHECHLTELDELGRRTATEDPLGHRVTYGLDAAGRVLSVTDELDHVTRYDYNGFGYLDSWTDALERVTHLEYDDAGRRVARVLPLLQREEWTYTLSGQVETHRDFNGHVTTNTHDPAFGRLESIAYQEGHDVEFTYWPGGARRTVEVEDQGTTTYDYEGVDPLADPVHGRGWLSQVETPDYTIEYGYDDAGNREILRTIVSAAEHDVEYTFDEQNRVSTVVEDSTTQATYTYDPAGLLAFLTYNLSPHDVEAEFVSDLAGRQQTITWSIGATTLASYDWTIDEAGRRTHVTELDGREVTYGYDEVDRLTSELYEEDEVCVREVTYTYDEVGSRLTRTLGCLGGLPEVTEYTHDDNDRMLTAGSEEFEYDSNGNTETTGTALYEWDDENRLVRATVTQPDPEPPIELEFEYDADGLRQATTVDAVTRTFGVVDTQWPHAQVLENRADDGSLLVRHLRGAGPVLRQGEGASTRWFVQDHLASTRALVENDGDVSDTMAYEGFGERIVGTGEASEIGFTREQWQDELGMEYLRARWMAAPRGAFASADPAWQSQASPSARCAYSYADLSPVSRVDPTGLVGEGELMGPALDMNNLSADYLTHIPHSPRWSRGHYLTAGLSTGTSGRARAGHQRVSAAAPGSW